MRCKNAAIKGLNCYHYCCNFVDCCLFELLYTPCSNQITLYCCKSAYYYTWYYCIIAAFKPSISTLLLLKVCMLLQNRLLHCCELAREHAENEKPNLLHRCTCMVRPPLNLVVNRRARGDHRERKRSEAAAAHPTNFDPARPVLEESASVLIHTDEFQKNTHSSQELWYTVHETLNLLRAPHVKTLRYRR